MLNTRNIFESYGLTQESIPFAQWSTIENETELRELIALHLADLPDTVDSLESDKESLTWEVTDLQNQISDLETLVENLEDRQGLTADELKENFARYTDECEAIYDDVWRDFSDVLRSSILRIARDLPVPVTTSYTILSVSGEPYQTTDENTYRVSVERMCIATTESIVRRLVSTVQVGGPIKAMFHEKARNYGFE